MASLVEQELESRDLSSIPLVFEFPYVFTETLLGLPPRKDVEFTIDLAPDTEFTYKAYRITLAKLKELKV